MTLVRNPMMDFPPANHSYLSILYSGLYTVNCFHFLFGRLHSLCRSLDPSFGPTLQCLRFSSYKITSLLSVVTVYDDSPVFLILTFIDTLNPYILRTTRFVCYTITLVIESIWHDLLFTPLPLTVVSVERTSSRLYYTIYLSLLPHITPNDFLTCVNLHNL